MVKFIFLISILLFTSCKRNDLSTAESCFEENNFNLHMDRTLFKGPELSYNKLNKNCKVFVWTATVDSTIINVYVAIDTLENEPPLMYYDKVWEKTVPANYKQ